MHEARGLGGGERRGQVERSRLPEVQQDVGHVRSPGRDIQLGQ